MAGYVAVGATPPSNGPWPSAEGRLWYQLQFAEVLAGREAQGWTLIGAADAWPVVQRWALRRITGLRVSSTARQDHARLAHMRLSVPLDVLHHAWTSEVRLLLPLYRGRSWRAILASFPSALRLVGALPLEVVCADMGVYGDAWPRVSAWASRHGYELDEHRLAPFQALPDPRRRATRQGSLYAASGTPPARTLDRPRHS